jgi:hypothetical protein
MSNFKFSRKLTDYLKKIELDTGREIKFFESPDLGIKGITAAYNYNPKYIQITLNMENSRSKGDREISIAHEATHGYLMHKLKFCRPIFLEHVDDNYKRDVHLVFTMIEDIIVNKIIQDNEFHPFGHEYLPMVTEEIKIAHKGEEEGERFYHRFTDNPHLEALLMISRYIIACGFLRYYHLGPHEEKIIKEFTRTFKKYYPDYYKFCVKIKGIIEEHNIFTEKGECQTIQLILQLFKLDERVKLTQLN